MTASSSRESHSARTTSTAPAASRRSSAGPVTAGRPQARAAAAQAAAATHPVRPAVRWSSEASWEET
jgi:hypothetical protein